MLRRTLIDLAAMLGIGTGLALLGPFGSYGAPFAVRLLFWAMLSGGGYFLYMPAMRGARWAVPRVGLPEPALWALACALASVPMTGIVWVANRLWTRPAPPTLDKVATLYGDVVLVAGIACAIMWFVARPVEDAAPPALVQAAPAPPRLHARLPRHLPPPVFALEMEDHYVRAHTAAGSVLLLMRLGDAIAELDGLAGEQVHRSWWVARHAVTGTVRDGRNVRLRLANGVEAPVARGTVAELKATGWL